MDVKLLKDLGDHKKGETVKIEDKTVLDAWVKLGVIEDSKKPKETDKK